MSPARLCYLVTHVPRTSLKSNIFLISSTCFFQDPSLDSPFSFAISHRGGSSGGGGGGGRGVRGGGRGKDETLLEDQSSQPAKKEKIRRKKRKVVHFCISPKASWLFVSAHYLASSAHAGSQAGKPKEGRFVLPREVI